MSSNREPMQLLAVLASVVEVQAQKDEADRQAFRERLAMVDTDLAALLKEMKQRFGDVSLRRYWCPLPKGK